MIKIISGSICSAKGFLASATHAGIGKNKEKPDLAIIYSVEPASVAGVFTKNKVRSASVNISKRHTKNGTMQAIIVNSGNANSCTGRVGIKNCKEIIATVSNQLKINKELVANASTGIIGVQLPIDNIIANIPQLIQTMSIDGEIQTARAIMTTDLFEKKIAVETMVAGKKVIIGGISKGSGMIHPNMATMLAFITTDAAISSSALQKALSSVNNESFNMISVDGETSTNDMVLMMANGMAGNNKINTPQDEGWADFVEALKNVCQFLAKEIVRDGEGATKLIEITVKGAKNKKQANSVVRAISSSPLVKTAIFASDANWGRIACAIGYSGAQVNLNKLAISLCSIPLLKDGLPLDFNEDLTFEKLKNKDVTIEVNLGVGIESAIGWGCDMSYDYIKINSSYRS